MVLSAIVIATLTLDSSSVARPIGQLGADQSRIREHLRTVEAELRDRDISHLPADLQRERARNLDRLHEYWVLGEFPQNDDFLGQRVPYFIDDSGILCAMGYLVVESGFANVALEIRATENNARLLDMRHPALPTWIAASGLTAEECARIQPAYCDCPDEQAPVCGVDGNTYANACYAETCAGVQIAHEGPCEDGTTGWPDPGSSASEGSEDSGSGGESGSESGSGGDESGDDGKQESKSCRIDGTPSVLTLLLPLSIALARRRRD